METEISQSNTIEYFLKKNILISKDAKEEILKLTPNQLKELSDKIKEQEDQSKFFILTNGILKEITEKKLVENEARGYENEKHPPSPEANVTQSRVNVIFSYDEKATKREVSHFVSYFRNRFKVLEQMLQNRNELVSRISILRAKERHEKAAVSVIGMVTNKRITKNNNIMITLEDMTGSINVIVNKNRGDEMFLEAKNIVLDEVMGVAGTASNGMIFGNKIISPDIPKTKELKKSPVKEYAAFLGDPHVGSNQFLKKEFTRLIDWFNGRVGDEKQKEIAQMTKYLFIVGDMVDGVGIYPGQEEELSIPDIYEQYREFTRYIKKIPSSVSIIICGGNHDAMRIAEPQPALYEDFAEELYALPNVVLVSNPAQINIGKNEGFGGFDVLLYHGYSFTYYADTVEYIRTNGGMERADLIMEMLLKKRHLAPSHKSNLYIPDPQKDPLIINKIPDFFVTGHIHRTTAKNFNGISLLNCSSWIGQTPFQEKVGLKPQPARLPLVDLQTREIKIIKFGKDEYT